MAKIYGYRMKVRDFECDAQSNVNNSHYLHYFEATCHEMMESCGLKFKDLTQAK